MTKGKQLLNSDFVLKIKSNICRTTWSNEYIFALKFKKKTGWANRFIGSNNNTGAKPQRRKTEDERNSQKEQGTANLETHNFKLIKRQTKHKTLGKQTVPLPEISFSKLHDFYILCSREYNFFNMKLNNFRGVLTDTSAKTKSLSTTCHTHLPLKRLDQALLPPKMYVGWDLVTTLLRLSYGLWIRHSNTQTMIRCKLDQWILFLRNSTTAFSLLRLQTCDCRNGAEAAFARKFPKVHGKITAKFHRNFFGHCVREGFAFCKCPER